MRFPLALTLKIAKHIVLNKLRGVKRFALVLQLEPLHACNLSCSGCGRIREYASTLKQFMTLKECLDSAAECNAPMVSICGGEPLIYPQIEELVVGLLKQKRIVYICTNGTLMRRKLRDYIASLTPSQKQTIISYLKLKGLLSDKTASEILNQPIPQKPPIAPSKWIYWNVHIDGLENTHDAITGRKGVFNECVEAIKLAKALGFQVAINTTVYRETNMDEIEEMFKFLSRLGVDGFTISPGFDYDAAKLAMVQQGNKNPDDFFLTRNLTIQKFSRIIQWGEKYPILNTPIYQEFLAGKRDLTCTAWAIPTRNIRGWKSPCYLITDTHYPTFKELIEKTDWDKYGVVNGSVKDSRCKNCMVHCGYDPSGALGINYMKGDLWKNIKYNFGSKPKPIQ
jgi:hopanoid biosynthesis associated radical SAM protein HpnH